MGFFLKSVTGQTGCVLTDCIWSLVWCLNNLVNDPDDINFNLTLNNYLPRLSCGVD